VSWCVFLHAVRHRGPASVTACLSVSAAHRGFVPSPQRIDCLYIAPHNLAFDRPTRQSSTYAQKFSFLVRASRRLLSLPSCARVHRSRVVGIVCAHPQAVNGVKDGVNEETCTHTQYDHEPWWEVDLGDVATIDHIIVYSRRPNASTDFPQRICPYYIMGSVTPFPGFSGKGRQVLACCSLR
jgi:hypothetical protein